MTRGTVIVHRSLASGLSRIGIPQRSSFERWTSAAVTGARRRRATELSIRLVDEDESRELNARYRKRDYPTNVLSFPAEFPAGVIVPLIGDLIICAPIIACEASTQGKALRDHYAHMTVHGVLHLLGYDHEADVDAETMEALEMGILATCGVENPYL